jgi:hypothetical protein
MTRKNISTTDITAGITDAERLLSLAPPGAASAERAVLPFRLTQLVVARFDMDVVEAAVFLNLCGAAPIQASQNADAEFHVHLRRVIDRYRLDCLFVEDAPGQYRHATRPRGYDYSVDAVHPKDMEAWRATIEVHSVQQIFTASIIWRQVKGITVAPSTVHILTRGAWLLRENDALSDWGRRSFRSVKRGIS